MITMSEVETEYALPATSLRITRPRLANLLSQNSNYERHALANPSSACMAEQGTPLAIIAALLDSTPVIWHCRLHEVFCLLFPTAYLPKQDNFDPIPWRDGVTYPSLKPLQD